MSVLSSKELLVERHKWMLMLLAKSEQYVAERKDVERLGLQVSELRAALEHIARVEPNGWGCYVRERLALLDGKPSQPKLDLRSLVTPEAIMRFCEQLYSPGRNHEGWAGSVENALLDFADKAEGKI